MKWMLILVFLFSVVGIEIYRNVELVKASYILQKLEVTLKDLEKENGYLKQKLSSSLSLSSLERRARRDLNLRSPQEIKFIRENLPPEENKFLFFPLGILKTIRRLLGKLNNLLL